MSLLFITVQTIYLSDFHLFIWLLKGKHSKAESKTIKNSEYSGDSFHYAYCAQHSANLTFPFAISVSTNFNIPVRTPNCKDTKLASPRFSGASGREIVGNSRERPVTWISLFKWWNSAAFPNHRFLLVQICYYDSIYLWMPYKKQAKPGAASVTQGPWTGEQKKKKKVLLLLLLLLLLLTLFHIYELPSFSTVGWNSVCLVPLFKDNATALVNSDMIGCKSKKGV